MSKTQKILLVVVLVVVIAIIIYFVFIRKKSGDSTTSDTTTNEGAFPLKMGSKGKEVEQLQTYLIKQYGAQFPKFGVDGDWGSETDANVKKWLKRDNVSQDVYIKWSLDKIKTNTYK